jgi:hypothetical protein
LSVPTYQADIVNPSFIGGTERELEAEEAHLLRQRERLEMETEAAHLLRLREMDEMEAEAAHLLRLREMEEQQLALTPALAEQINAAVSPVMTGGGGTVVNNFNNQPAYNLTTQSITQPGALALEFDAMELASR